MIIELVVFLTSVAGLIWWLLCPSANLRTLGDKIPGPPTYPLVGNATNFNIVGPKCFDDFINARKKYGRVFKIWLGPQLHVFLTDPNDIQMLLSSTTIITKSYVYKVLDEWLGTGLLISSGDLWHRRRKAITPTFHFKVLDDFVPIFNKCGDTLIDLLNDKSGKEEFDIIPFLSNCALDTVAQSAMGVTVEAQIKPKSSYVTAILEMTKILSLKINKPWLGVEPIYTITGQKGKEKMNLKILHDLPRKVLKEKKEEIQSRTRQQSFENEFGIKKRCAFLELLLDMDQKKQAFQTEQDIMDEVTTFMFEGHDTTTACLTFTIWLLGKHPDIQENVYKEVSSIIIDNEDMKMEHLQNMKYLERVIKESLRIYPSVPMIGRQVYEDTVLPSGYTIPAGANVYAGIFLVHRDAEYFPEPDLFNPDRFLNEMAHPYCYIPFSAGPRNCIGQKFAMTDLKTILAKVILRYKIQSNCELQLDPEMVLRTTNAVNIKLIQRQNNF